MIFNIILMCILISSVLIDLHSRGRIKLRVHVTSSRNCLFQTSVKWWFVYFQSR